MPRDASESPDAIGASFNEAEARAPRMRCALKRSTGCSIRLQ